MNLTLPVFQSRPDSASRSLLENIWSLFTASLAIFTLFLILLLNFRQGTSFITPIMNPISSLKPLTDTKKGYEVFGFAPWWNFEAKLDNVDFSALTTFAYFGIPVSENGDLIQDDQGYKTFMGEKATQIFKKAHSYGTRVVLTITQMDNAVIESFLSNPSAQENTINQVIAKVKERGIDGVNVDFEYSGNPGEEYRRSFSSFVTNLSTKMHAEMPNSRITVSVYASAARGGKLWDIKQLSAATDGIFMMAYDFSVAGSDNAAPTAPLFGYKAGKYAYDISTAVEDFLRVMPANKLILGVPLYGYNYLVYAPSVNAQTRPYYSWRGKPTAQTYDYAQENINARTEGVDAYLQGWDNVGKVGWRAYHIKDTDTWRMLFLDDAKSLSLKYDFAKNKGLSGVGMWALGNDSKHGKELWSLVKEKFGTKLADSSLLGANN